MIIDPTIRFPILTTTVDECNSISLGFDDYIHLNAFKNTLSWGFDYGHNKEFYEILMITNLGELWHILDYLSAYGDWGCLVDEWMVL